MEMVSAKNVGVEKHRKEHIEKWNQSKKRSAEAILRELLSKFFVVNSSKQTIDFCGNGNSFSPIFVNELWDYLSDENKQKIIPFKITQENLQKNWEQSTLEQKLRYLKNTEIHSDSNGSYIFYPSPGSKTKIHPNILQK